jgi:hypothetical protein
MQKKGWLTAVAVYVRPLISYIVALLIVFRLGNHQIDIEAFQMAALNESKITFP